MTRLVRLAAIASLVSAGALTTIAVVAYRAGNALIHHTCGATP